MTRIEKRRFVLLVRDDLGRAIAAAGGSTPALELVDDALELCWAALAEDALDGGTELAVTRLLVTVRDFLGAFLTSA